MKLWLKYSLINTLLGACIALYICCNSTDSSKFQLFISNCLSAFIVSGVSWKLLVKESDFITLNSTVTVGFLVGSVSHYFTFVIWGLLRIICYWTTWNCTDSFGGSPDLFGAFVASIPISIGTLILYGWITIPAAIIGGLILCQIHNQSIN